MRAKALFPSALFAVALALLAGVGWAAYRNAAAMEQADRWATHTRDVIQQLDQLLSTLKDVETGQRGFLVTGEEKYLEPYSSAISQVSPEIASLKELTRDNPVQQKRLKEMEPVIAEKLAILEHTIEVRRAEGFEAARQLVVSDIGKARMDDIRARVSVLVAEEERLLQRRAKTKAIDTRAMLQTVAVGGLLSVAMLLMGFSLLRMELVQRIRAEREVKHQRDQLDELVKSRTAELAAAFASMSEAIFIADAGGRLTAFNDGFVRYHRFRNRDECSRTIADCPKYLDASFADGTSAPPEQWAMARALRGETASNVEYRLHRKETGETWWGSYNFAPIKDKDGGIAGAVVSARETTALKQAEEAVRRSETLLRAITNNSPDPIFLKDRGSRILLANPATLAALGKRAEQVLGKTDEEFYDDAEAGRRIVANDRRVMESGQIEVVEEVVPGRAGPRIYLSTKTPYRDAEGVVIGVIGIARDITERKRAEETLRKSQQLLQDVIDGSPSPIFLKDSDGKFLTINTSLEKMLGMTREELKGKTDYDIAPKEVADSWRAHDKQVMETGKGIQIEEVSDLPDGHHIFLATKFPLVDANGQIYGVGAISHDITERKQIEQALRNSRERLDLALDSSRMATFDWDIVNNKRTWTRGVHALLGTHPEAFTGRAEEFFQVIHPEDRGAVQSALARAVETAGKYETEYRAVWPDGSTHHISARGTVHRDSVGRAVRMTGVCWDVTQRKQAEEALRESRAKLEAALASMTDAVFISDVQGRFADFNDAFATFHRFRSKAECLKTLAEYPDILEVFMANGEPAPLEQWAVPRALRGESATNAVYGLRRKDTGETWIGSYSFAPIRDKDGAIVGSVVAGRDITEQKRLEDAVKASLREKEVMLKEIHHRVKNNLQVIASLVDLQAGSMNDPGLLEMFADIRDRVRSMALVHEKLYQSESLARVDFADYMHSLLCYLARSHGEPGSAIELKSDLQPVALSVEKAVPCGLMVNELVSNAYKHAFRGRAGGEVRAALGMGPNGRVWLRVSDNGVGLPPGLDWRQSSSLGLRLIQLLAGQLHASVEVRAGNGTEFEIAFELEKPEQRT
jgi:PAS domain S-box-containing protein